MLLPSAYTTRWTSILVDGPATPALPAICGRAVAARVKEFGETEHSILSKALTFWFGLQVSGPFPFVLMASIIVYGVVSTLFIMISRVLSAHLYV